MLATCMVMGDGILTPAISVLSAIEGLKVATPSISQDAIVIISVVLLIGLFVLQRFGTEQISFIFSPIVVTWLTTTSLIGLYNIFKHFPSVYKAISPYYALKFFFIHGKNGWLALGGTTLCITGVEAMFADLGHFNKQSMQLGFLLGVYPSNIITYAGLTAYLIKNPEHQAQAFYKFTPKSMFWPMFILSTLTAIVASQGLISACFSLIKQCMALDCFPSVQIIHTSSEHEGQVYSPQVNFSLMVMCAAILFGFHNGNSLGNAYGVAVILVMLTTTMLVTLVMVGVWGVSTPLALSFFGFFTLVEICNLSAVLSKVPTGGWLPFLLAFLLAIIVFTWVEARAKLTHYELSHSIALTSFTHMLQTANISRVPGVCFIHMLPQIPMQTPLFCSSPNTTPPHCHITSNHINQHPYTNHLNYETSHSNNHPNHHSYKNIDLTKSFSNHKIDHFHHHHNHSTDHFEQHLSTSIDHVPCSPHHTHIQLHKMASQETNHCNNHTIEVEYHDSVDENAMLSSLPTSFHEPYPPSEKNLAYILTFDHPLEENTHPHSHEPGAIASSPKLPTNISHPLHQIKKFVIGAQKCENYASYDHMKTLVNPLDHHSKQYSGDPSHHKSHASSTNCLVNLDNHSIKKCDISTTHENERESDTLVPPLLQHYVQNTHSLHKVVVLTSFHIAKVPELTKATQFQFELLNGRLPNGTPSQEVLDTFPYGMYLCTIHVGYAQPINEQCNALTGQLLEHLEEFIRRKLIVASANNLVESRKLEGQMIELQKGVQKWEGQVEEVERAKVDMGGSLTVHMVSIPKLKLPPKSNFLYKLALHKLYPLLQFHNPFSTFLSQVPTENVLELAMTYEV